MIVEFGSQAKPLSQILEETQQLVASYIGIDAEDREQIEKDRNAHSI